jgi:hypothetical protein
VFPYSDKIIFVKIISIPEQQMIVDKLRPYLPFIMFATVLLAAIFTIEKINGRFWLNDFKVYYSAAQSLLNGEQVYGTPFGLDTGFYKYSPFVAMLFVPYTFFPYEIAIIIHFLILSAATILSIIILGKLIGRYFQPVKTKTENLLMSLALVCILLHLVRELHLGNINMLLLLLASSGLIFSVQSKDIFSGICVGLAIIIKPYFLVLVLPFLAAGRWRALISIGATAAVSFLIPMLALGYTRNILLYDQWMDSMREHSTYLSSNHTIQSLLNNYFGVQTGKFFFYFLIATIFSGYFFLYFFLRNREESSVQFYFISGYFCLLGLIPNLVITDTEHFLLSLPLIIILLCYVSEKKKPWLIAAFIILVFFYEGNSTDLLGKNLSQRFEEAGLLGISNLIIIGAVLALNFFNTKKVEGIKSN